MSSSANWNRMRLGSAAPAYAQRMSEATYAAGQQYWKDPNVDYPYFYAESTLYRPLPYMTSARGPPKSALPLSHQAILQQNYVRRNNSAVQLQRRFHSSQKAYFDDSSQDVTVATREKMSATDERQWEYTTLGSLIIGSNYDKSTVGDGTRLVVMSYNILAPSLLDNHRNLYDGCIAEALTVEYRMAKFFSEIEEFKPDVICLQEMEADYYHQTYASEFKIRGYSGVFMKRTRDKVDGCAIMFKTNTLSLVEKLSVNYYQPHVDILDRDNIGLLVKLQSKRGSKMKFVVGTTHLLYNPRRQDIRMAQVQFLLAELDRFAFCGYDQFNKHKYHPMLLSGDFNMEPYSTGVRLVTEGRISTIPEGYSMNKFKTGCLPPHFGVSDQCQHYKIVLERFKKMRNLKTKNFEFDLKHHKDLVNVGSLDSENKGTIKKVKIGSSDDSKVNGSQQNVATAATDTHQEFPLNSNDTHLSEPAPVPVDDEVTIVFERNVNSPRSSVASKMVFNDSSGWSRNDGLDEDLDVSIINKINEEGVQCSFGGGELSHQFHLKNVYGAQLDRKDNCENIATTKQIGWVCVDYIFYSTTWSHRYQKRVEGNLKLIRRYGLLNRQQCKKMGPMPNQYVPSDHFPLIAEFLLKK